MSEKNSYVADDGVYMSEKMIYIPLEDFERKCSAENELKVVKRYLEANKMYGMFNELRVILGMEIIKND